MFIVSTSEVNDKGFSSHEGCGKNVKMKEKAREWERNFEQQIIHMLILNTLLWTEKTGQRDF